MKPHHRDVSPFLKLIRDFLLGRIHVTNNRYEETVNSRGVPPPAPTPGGSTERLSDQQYFTRNPRSQVMPPVEVLPKIQEQDANAEKGAKAMEAGTPVAGSTAKPAPPAAAKAEPPAGGKSAPASTSGSMGQKQWQKEQMKKKNKSNGLPKPGKLHQWD